MKDIKNWLGKKSDTFSTLMEEDVTIREVLLVHGIVLCGCGAAVVAAASLSATVMFLGVALWLAWKLNKYSHEHENTLTREYMGWDEDGDRYREDDDDED